MKKILIATAVLAGFAMAAEPVAPKAPPTFDTTGLKIRIDSLRKADSALFAERKAKVDSVVKVRKAKDSTAFAMRPDSAKAKIDSARAAWKSAALADSGARKAKADSLRHVFAGKRDSAIARIKDTAVQNKIKAHLADVDAKKAEVKAKVEARRAEVKAKVEELKAKQETPATK